ncbi:MAG TPA: DoxX family protein [Terriglobales bacterium]
MRKLTQKWRNSNWHQIMAPAWRSRAVLCLRLAVGLVFLTQGILKYIDPNMGVNRFARIGFPQPYFTAHFVGAFEMVCGALVLLGFATRIAAVPLLIVICTAIASTKIPELARPHQGFWYMVSDARTDFAMLMSLLFLLRAGAGKWSFDDRLTSAEHLSAAEIATPRNEEKRIA